MATKVAFQGARGAYSEQAAIKYFGKSLNVVPCREFSEVFSQVARGNTKFGILPIENSRTGSIHQNFDLLYRFKGVISGEVALPIRHALIGHKKTKLEFIKRIYSHPQGLWQCQKFLSRLKKVDLIPHFDTAGSVAFVRDQDTLEAAAVASPDSAKQYGLKVLATKIQDFEKNYTRFIVIQKNAVPFKGKKAKTSILFSLKSIPGALYKSLAIFAERNIQLLKLESRPIEGKPWEYLFYVDFEAALTEKRVQEALSKLKGPTKKVKVLGCYRSGLK